jgi:hypothetical protein
MSISREKLRLYKTTTDIMKPTLQFCITTNHLHYRLKYTLRLSFFVTQQC